MRAGYVHGHGESDPAWLRHPPAAATAILELEAAATFKSRPSGHPAAIIPAQQPSMDIIGSMNGNAQLDEWDDAVDEVTSGGDRVDLWGLLVRRKWLILVGTVIGLVLGALHYARTKPTYESRANC